MLEKAQCLGQSSKNTVFQKKKKTPKCTEAELERISRCCLALKQVHFSNKLIVIDDTYFTLSNSEMKKNDGFYTDNFKSVFDNVKFKNKKKFEIKMV